MAHDLSSFNSSVLLVRDVAGDYRPADAGEVLQAAQRLLGQQLKGREVLSSPKVVRDFLGIKLGALEHEVSAVLMLDAQNRLIEYVELFRGTVSRASVYPREVVKESLARNAAALVLVHNHPSVCVRDQVVRIDGAAVANARLHDDAHRSLPPWAQCRRLAENELFLLSDTNPASFDSRYFGPIEASAVLGIAMALWTWSAP